MKVKDAISNIMNFKIPEFILKNYLFIAIGLMVLYVLYRLHQIGGKYLERTRYIEGLANEKLHPSNIDGAIDDLKQINLQIRQDLHVDKYKAKYEDYLVQLYDYVNLVALDECVRPEKNIRQKMKTLKQMDTRYTPLKDMVNDSIKTLNEAYTIESKRRK